MAGEVLGKTYEAMTRVALAMAGVPNERIFWDQRPKWMSIKADFVIGKELDRPEAVVLCAHSQSTKNSEMKFWRNLQEFFETKASLPKPLGAYNLVFNKSYKDKLLSIMSRVFDGHLEVPGTTYGKALLKHAGVLAAGPFKGIGPEGMVKKLQVMCVPGKPKDALRNNL